jgi:hypothetical protein
MMGSFGRLASVGATALFASVRWSRRMSVANRPRRLDGGLRPGGKLGWRFACDAGRPLVSWSGISPPIHHRRLKSDAGGRREIRRALLAKASRISSACRYSNVVVAKPVWKVFLAPLPILGGRVVCPEGGVVKDRLMGVKKRIFHALLEGSAGRRIKLCSPLTRNGHA